ncbi:DedA family protein [Niameybacter massiliensis]|uniref:DedA family protein n=1 Tax=Niameybacter massiliensis TaxID=1658108 RepID=UPI0006B5A333|nr:DedA family protein [Niameybacter massiliensis]
MENMETVVQYMQDYGIIFLFIIVYLEYLNLPGLPAGIIMPAAGFLVATSNINFIYALVISVIAGMLGSYSLYALGYYIGSPVVDKVYNKFKKSRPAIDKSFGYLDKYGNKGVFISRLIPVARTLISLVAGTGKMKVWSFTIYSIGGIAIWNCGFILAGYIMGIVVR